LPSAPLVGIQDSTTAQNNTIEVAKDEQNFILEILKTAAVHERYEIHENIQDDHFVILVILVFFMDESLWGR